VQFVMGGTETYEGGRAREIGARIVQARKELGGMRQEELADLIHVSVRSMQAYEAGEVVPYRKLKALETVLGKSMAWILHGEDTEPGLRNVDKQLVEVRDTLATIYESNQRRDQLLAEILEHLKLVSAP
jgi:transcriptional regulator with XRE-family HTH domain